MKKFAAVAVMLLAIALAVTAMAGCGSSSSSTKTYTITNTKISAKVGDTFILSLASNQTTGFQWGISGSMNSSVVTKVGTVYVPNANPKNMVGVGGVEKWTFKAVGAGTGTIVMIYSQPFDKTSKPAKTVTFTVTVK